MALVWLLHLLTTWMMTGIIWFVQVVHYPLFARVGEANFTQYEGHHTWRTGLVVAPLMLIELATAGLWLWEAPHVAWRWVNLALLGVIWLSTALIQVPLHTRLSQGYDPAAQQRLVRSNWIRTIAWSLRALGLLAFSVARYA